MNMNINRIVKWGDRICASLECNGRRLAAVNSSCFASLDSVKQTLLEMAGRYEGLAVITVRNCTQGWRDVTSLATMRRPALNQHTMKTSLPHAGSQYLIPWAS